ncbi:MAG: hypothetical protein U0794_10645 [Isosphaeraceae bacterium]
MVAVECPRCGWKQEVYRPRTTVSMAEATCPTCRAPGRPEVISEVAHDSPLAACTLKRLGVPPYDIVRVESTEASHFALLAADRRLFDF